MKRLSLFSFMDSSPPCLRYVLNFLVLFAAFFLIEFMGFCLLLSQKITGIIFGMLWAGLLACVVLALPRKAGRITFGILYFFYLLWTLAQAGYFLVFGKMMWLSTIAYAGEGAGFLGDVLGGFPFFWWIALALMIAIGVLVLIHFPKGPEKVISRLYYLLGFSGFVVTLILLPMSLFSGKDTDEYRQSSSPRAIYNTMYDAKKVYDLVGIYQLTLRDLWVNELYPLTPGYRDQISQQVEVVDDYFAKRGEATDNNMTGCFEGNNVILVLMESMDDWMITKEDTPTIRRLMDEGINFTNFYTPGYGSARTLNSEFCMNTGVYLPTTGSYVFDYVTNSFDQSIASQLTQKGYSSYVFHYNNPEFYSRGVLEPAIGYEKYVAYSDYEKDRTKLCDDNLLFDLPEVKEQFFREGATFNTIITRSAHLGYTYNEIIGNYALKKYPHYRDLYASEEEICARVKAKLVDDLFARLLQELEEQGQLHDTVIIAMTDHYTYGYKNMAELYTHSGVKNTMLLEKVPCFIWSADKPDLDVDKVLNTADLLPTMLNLLGVDSPYNYLGQDAFDPAYPGYALFPDGGWICDGIAWRNGQVLMNNTGMPVSQQMVDTMASLSEEFRKVSNLLLTCNYYN